MKTLKITLLLALFLSVSSQSNQTPTDKNATIYNQHNIYKLLAHSRGDVKLPTQG